MIVALAGRRIDSLDSRTNRFPLVMKDFVRERILDCFKKERVTMLISSAACGADLLAQDAARELKIEQQIILPFDRKRFRETSVTDRPGDWGGLFDEICDEAEKTGNLIVLEGLSDEERAYSAVTDEILKRAELIRSTHEAILAVAVWDGKAKDNADETALFIDRANSRNVEVREISTKS